MLLSWSLPGGSVRGCGGCALLCSLLFPFLSFSCACAQPQKPEGNSDWYAQLYFEFPNQYIACAVHVRLQIQAYSEGNVLRHVFHTKYSEAPFKSIVIILSSTTDWKSEVRCLAFLLSMLRNSKSASEGALKNVGGFGLIRDKCALARS